MAFKTNRSASRFLNKGIRATKFLETMDKVIPRDKLTELVEKNIEKRIQGNDEDLEYEVKKYGRGGS